MGGKPGGALITTTSGAPRFKINATGNKRDRGGTIQYEYAHTDDPLYTWWYNESSNKHLTAKELNKLLGTLYSTKIKVCR